MFALGLLVLSLVPPALAFAFPAHSSARPVLATSIFWWTLLVGLAAWMARINYSGYTRADKQTLHLFTVRGRRTLDLGRLDQIRSLSLWGRSSTAHLLRLHTTDGQHATVVADMTVSSFNRKVLAREQKVRNALRPHANLADARAKYWLEAGPRPPRAESRGHFVRMLGLFLLGIFGLFLVLVVYLAFALH